MSSAHGAAIRSYALMTRNTDIYDRNAPDDFTVVAPAAGELMDDTLRDGLQNPSVTEKHWLRVRGFEPVRALVQTLLERAQRGHRVLSDPDVLQIVRDHPGARPEGE